MKSLAEALVGTAAFLEFAEDDVFNFDTAMDVLDQISAIFENTSKEEKEAILIYCAQSAQSMNAITKSDIARRDFYLEFGENFWSEEE